MWEKQSSNAYPAFCKAMHDLNMAVRYCDRLLMLNKGRVYSCGGKEILSAESIRERDKRKDKGG